MNARRSRNGFSLVEVTLALGIMAFCLVALFGLLPAWLRFLREDLAPLKRHAGRAVRARARERGRHGSRPLVKRIAEGATGTAIGYACLH